MTDAPTSARDQALAAIEAHGLSDLLERAAGLLDDDPGHDLEHALRVAGWTLRCCVPEDGVPEDGVPVPPREALAAALLHDAVNVPKDDPRRAEASALSAREVRKLLPAFGFDEDAIERVAEAVEDHSYSRGAVPRSALGRALQDADRLEALGALGLLRTASCGTLMGARFVHPTDPWARARELDDRRYSVDHFFTKLLKLPASLQTAPGRAEARRRTAFLEAFLDQLSEELGQPRPGEADAGEAGGG